MASPRHKHVLDRPSRLPGRAILGRVRARAHGKVARVGLAAAAVTALGGSAVAMTGTQQEPVSAAAIEQAPVHVTPLPVSVRQAPISRSETRVRLKPKPEPPPKVTDHQFATARLNVWNEPSEAGTLLDVLDPGDKVAVSGVVKGEWAEVVVDEKSRWVHAAYLSDTKPKPAPEPTTSTGTGSSSGGLSTAACATGSDVESGLVPNAVAVHRAACAAFPQVTSYGGVRPGDPGEHGTGHALDIMISDSSTGDAIAEWARSHASELGISEVIWAQHIWTVERSSEGWRPMEDRGSTTANHYDHVHVTVY